MNNPQIEKHGFRLIERLDETSQTVVWKAVQNTLDRVVIIRVLKPEAAANASEVDHFLAIARRFARIKSDSLAAVFDIVSEGDLHYVVVEHVEGPTLGELVAQRGPLPVDQILRIAAALGNSLEQMWSTSHIVHRNLKSAAIRLDPRSVAKITDFSLAIVAGPGVDATGMDGGHIVGTPCFLSPEQAQGAHLLTTQSDMYALGAVLYHLATGKVPFEEHDVLAILAAHVKQQIPPPHRLNPAVPAAFSWLVHRLMMKNPNNRYADWGDVLSDIRSILAGKAPACVRPDEEYLSTILKDFDEAAMAEEEDTYADDDDELELDLAGPEEDIGAAAPSILLNRKTTSATLLAFQGKPLIEDHEREIGRNDRLFRLGCWGMLAAWLLLVFWFRAVYQNNPQKPDETAPRGQLRVAFTQISQSLAALFTPTPNKDADALPPPAAPSAPLPAAQPPAPEPPQPLPAGIPDTLRQGLAQAFAKADLAAARQLVKTSSERFQEKEALLSLINQIPEPDVRITEYLKLQVGRPLVIDYNGKPRTFIVRGVTNGVIQVEANGRAAELAIDTLSADVKLNWLEKPRTPAQIATYCVTLMRSSRRAETAAQAANCPLLSAVLIEAAGLVPAVTPRAE